MAVDVSDDRDFSDLVKSPVSTRSPGISVPEPEPTLGIDSLIGIGDIKLPVRLFNFSQWYAGDGMRATIRNNAYKLNYDDRLSPEYSLYAYSGGEVPGREDDATATDVFNDALTGTNADAAANLDILLDELIATYQADPNTPFPDPR